MCCKGWMKRVLPFFAAFVVSIFVASFFVRPGVPNWNFRGHRYEVRELRMQLDQEREENNELRNQINEMRSHQHPVVLPATHCPMVHNAYEIGSVPAPVDADEVPPAQHIKK